MNAKAQHVSRGLVFWSLADAVLTTITDAVEAVFPKSLGLGNLLIYWICLNVLRY